MKKTVGNAKVFLAAGVLVSMMFSAFPAIGQPGGDLVPFDLTGGSSVFVIRTSTRPAPRRFVSRAKIVRTVAQRKETARKVSRQYVTLAKLTPRRERTRSVDPFNLPPPPVIGRMPKDEASRLFAGVGEYYMDKDDFDKAIDFFREADSLDNTNARARSGLSEALALKGNEVLVRDEQRDAARKFFEEALTYNPKSAAAYFGLAEVYAAMDNRDEEAIANYEKALANDKDLTEIYVPLGILYYEQAQTAKSADRDALMAKSEDLLTKALAGSSADTDSQLQHFIGLHRLNKGQDKEALAAFEKAKTLDPAFAEAFTGAGDALARLRRHKEAVEEYRKAAALKQNYFEAAYGMGVAYFEMDNYNEAANAFRQAVRYRNTSIDAYNYLGDTLRLSRRFDEAEANYILATTFIERDPDYSKEEAADVYSNIGFVVAKQCEINSPKGIPCRWDVAVRALEKAAAITGGIVDAANVGWAYYNSARTDILLKRDPAQIRAKLEKAKENLQKAAFSSPKFIEGPLLNLGMTLTDLGDYAGAVDALKRVVEKRPQWVFALNELGIAYRKQDNYKEAANYFREAIKRDGKYAIAHYNLAEAEFRAGNIGEAKKAYNRVRSLGRPDLAAKLELLSGGQLRG